MKVAYFLATLVAVVSAGTVGNPSLSGGSIGSGSGSDSSDDLYNPSKPPSSGNSGSSSGSNGSSSGSSGDKCSDCVKYCSSDSNGKALGAACLIIKCGISCIIA